MNFMGIAMIVMGVLFIICVLTLKDPKKVKKEKPKKK